MKISRYVLPIFLVSALASCAATPQKRDLVLGANPATIVMYDNASLTLSGPLICDTHLGINNNRRDFTVLYKERSGRELIDDLKNKRGPELVKIPADGNTVFAVSQSFSNHYAIAFFEFPVEGGASYRVELEPIKRGLFFKTAVNFTVKVYKNEKPIPIKLVPQPRDDKSCDINKPIS
jgi:hypothetical protein